MKQIMNETQFTNNFAAYTDIYFLRSLKILKKLDLNPFARVQVFLRGKDGFIFGQSKVIEIIKKHSSIIDNGGRVFFLPDGERYKANETVLLIEARIQDIIAFETIILGILSSETTILNDGKNIHLGQITERVKQIVSLVEGRKVYYFGARHWSFSKDAVIAKAAFLGGVAGVSTQIGADQENQLAVGTIPHSLEVIFAWKYGVSDAVSKTTQSFHEIIEDYVPRIALIDYNNREIDDSLKVARLLGDDLYGIRIDTPGENISQGGSEFSKDMPKYWTGKGVTVDGVASIRKTLNKEGFVDLKITLSGGFGNIDKVKAFVDAEKKLHLNLFNSLGVGGIFDCRQSTMDIVGVGEKIDTMVSMAKVGRSYKSNARLVSL